MFVLFLLWATGGSAWASSPAYPARACEEVWLEKASGDYLYDFKQDTVLTPRGNEGYKTFQDRQSSKKIERTDCYKNWTVLVYMAASPDLVPYANADLYEMEATYDKVTKVTGSTLRTDVLVQLDNKTTLESRRLHMFQSPLSPSKALKKEDLASLSLAAVHSPIVSTEKTSAAPLKQRFKDFLLWGTRQYPSEHYLVIVWGHGKGWTSLVDPQRRIPGGVAIGEGEHLDIPGLRSVLEEVKEQIQDRIDVLVSDACLMQTVEDTTELERCTRFISGSEDTQTYAGLPYGNLLATLNRGRFKIAHRMIQETSALPGGRRAYYNLDESYLVAWTIPHLYKKSLQKGGSQELLDPKGAGYLTGNTVETKQLRRTLLPALDRLGTSLVKYVSEKSDRWMKLRMIIEKGKIYDGGTQDIGAFIKAVADVLKKEKEKTPSIQSTASVQDLETQLRLAYEALNYTTVNGVLGSNYPTFNPFTEMGPRGLAIWLPKTDEDYAARAADFSRSIFYNQYRGWYNWMQILYLPPAQRELALSEIAYETEAKLQSERIEAAAL